MKSGKVVTTQLHEIIFTNYCQKIEGQESETSNLQWSQEKKDDGKLYFMVCCEEEERSICWKCAVNYNDAQKARSEENETTDSMNRNVIRWCVLVRWSPSGEWI